MKTFATWAQELTSSHYNYCNTANGLEMNALGVGSRSSITNGKESVVNINYDSPSRAVLVTLSADRAIVLLLNCNYPHKCWLIINSLKFLLKWLTIEENKEWNIYCDNLFVHFTSSCACISSKRKPRGRTASDSCIIYIKFRSKLGQGHPDIPILSL